MLEQIELLRNHGHEGLAKSLCIHQFLREELEKNPVCTEDAGMDLNPQLVLKHTCEQVVLRMHQQHFLCTTEDVMLVWLTMAVYTGLHTCIKENKQ